MGLISQTEQQYYSGNDYGGYQFVTLQNIIDQFMVVYVGEDKIISKASKIDVAFHAQRALAEMSFDTFKSTKSIEQIVPPSLTMPLPIDFVNYVKVSYIDSVGVKHNIYPNRKTSNPKSLNQDGTNYQYNADGSLMTNSDSTAWTNYKSATPTELSNNDFDYDDDVYNYNIGQRYGLEPEHSQVNGFFYIDELKGNIHFSSNINGKSIILDYISDSLGTDSEMQVHKFAEEAMYKQISYAIISTKINIPEYIVQRYKKEARASKRQAKLRLSNIKFEEIVQILRGKSKHIKH